MKLIALSKSVPTIGVMVLLSVMVGTTGQQPVHAQPIAQDDNRVCVPLPENVFYEEFAGITFSPEQMAAYREIESRINERYATVGEPQRVNSEGLDIEHNPEFGDEKAFEIVAASDELIRKGLSVAEQIERLTEQYGRYAKFSFTQSIIYTPEQIAKGQQIGRDFEAQTMAILTPEQRPIYVANLALQRRIQACSEPFPFDRIISSPPVVAGSS